MSEPRKYSEWRKTANGRWRDAFHTFGHLWFEHARDDAISQIPPNVSQETRAIATKAITHALYNTMMILEGVVPVPADGKTKIEFALIARVSNPEIGDSLIETIEIAPDGEETVCMGFHFWTAGNFRE